MIVVKFCKREENLYFFGEKRVLGKVESLNNTNTLAENELTRMKDADLTGLKYWENFAEQMRKDLVNGNPPDPETALELLKIENEIAQLRKNITARSSVSPSVVDTPVKTKEVPAQSSTKMDTPSEDRTEEAVVSEPPVHEEKNKNGWSEISKKASDFLGEWGPLALVGKGIDMIASPLLSKVGIDFSFKKGMDALMSEIGGSLFGSNTFNWGRVSLAFLTKPTEEKEVNTLPQKEETPSPSPTNIGKEAKRVARKNVELPQSNKSALITKLKDQIATWEGGANKNTHYDSIGGYSGKNAKKLKATDLTISEIIRRGSLPDGHDDKIADAGKYQGNAEVTLPEWVKKKGVDPNRLFSEDLQEEFGNYIFFEKRPQVAAFLNGSSTDIEKTMQALSYEFHSLPNSDGEFYGKHSPKTLSRLKSEGRHLVIRDILESIQQHRYSENTNNVSEFHKTLSRKEMEIVRNATVSKYHHSLYLLQTPLLNLMLELAREFPGIKFNSTLRSEKKNKSVNGAKHSDHLYGCACDILPSSIKGREKDIKAYINKIGKGKFWADIHDRGSGNHLHISYRKYSLRGKDHSKNHAGMKKYKTDSDITKSVQIRRSQLAKKPVETVPT